MLSHVSTARAGLSALVCALMCLTSGVPAFSQSPSVATERFFKIDWHVERRDGQDVAIVGIVRNEYLYSLRRLELQVQVLDEGGRVLGEVFGRIDRDVPPGGRWGFRLPLRERGARYAVLVYGFDFGERESP
jgi:hypothetical protein